MNDFSDDEINNYEVAPNPSRNYVHITSNSDDEKNYYKVTPDTPTNGGNN